MAKIISGTETAKSIRQELRQLVSQIQNQNPNLVPGLAIVQVGGRDDSNVYIRMKIRAAAEIGIEAQHVKLPRTITQSELLTKLDELNNDENVHGIIVQMPLDCEEKIDSDLVTDYVSPEKDVDGLHTLNEGRTAINTKTGFVPCTPNGCIELIKRSGIPMAGTRAVVLGRSKIVGTPVSELLKWNDATVTVCHSKTKNLPDVIREADILVVAIGRPKFVKGAWIKPNAVVIDCGINSISVLDPVTNTTVQRLCGDVDFDEASKVASHITPVPGGVGPMTVAMLMKNTVQSYVHWVNRITGCKQWNLTPLPLHLIKPVPSDIAIARAQQPKDIKKLADEIGLQPNEVNFYGPKKAKISLNLLNRLRDRPDGNYIVVAGITPTPLGEGKSTCTIGLAQALAATKCVNAMACLRQPSQGPTFGIKGGAAGGGYSQVIPMEDFNLHLTGDIHAITAANNLLAAQLDARIFHESTQTTEALYNRLVPIIKGKRTFSTIQLRRLKRLNIQKTDPNELTAEEISRFSRLNIDPKNVVWTRVLDINDRFLREITIGESKTEKGFIRKESFAISVASEIMAVLALSQDLTDMKERLAKMVVAFDLNGNAVLADDLGITGALMILLKDTIEPTLMQTLEGTPVFVHAGPFANIAHGCSSIVSDNIALKLVGRNGFCITEAGFGSDIGMEKFFDIKCRISQKVPDAVVLVTTVRALKMHGGGPAVTPGAPLKSEYTTENIDLVKQGLPNLIKHISNGTKFGVPVVVCINVHANDTAGELEVVRKAAIEHGAFDAVVSYHYAEGGKGAEKLADALIKTCKNKKSTFRFLYELNKSIEEKITKIAQEMYGAGEVEFQPIVKEKIQIYNAQGFNLLPICMAKTSNSLTADPMIKGAPVGFKIVVNDIFISAGAGFIVPICGDVAKMPGLPTRPCFYDMDLNTENGEIKGLF